MRDTLFDDFVAAAATPSLGLRLASIKMAGDQAIAALEVVSDALATVTSSHAIAAHAIGHVSEGVSNGSSAIVKASIKEALKCITGGRPLAIDTDYLFRITGTNNSSQLWDRWDSDKIALRVENDFPDMDAALLKQGLSRFNSVDFDDKALTIYVWARIFERSFSSGYDPRLYGEETRLGEFLHALDAVATGTRNVASGAHPALTLPIFERRKIHSSEVFRWHSFESPAFRGLRPYKDAGTSFRARSPEIYAAIKEALTSEIEAR